MKKLIICILLAVGCLSAAAQIGVGVDLRLAPWGDVEGRNIGSDITANYKYHIWKSVFIQPSVGLFYQNMYYEMLWVATLDPIDGGGGVNNTDPTGYRVGIDATMLIGMDVWKGLSVYTGPRYGYAFAQHNRTNDEFLPHTLEWRVGVGYAINNKFTVSLKCDFGLLKLLKADKYYSNSEPKQATSLVLGIAYAL